MARYFMAHSTRGQAFVAMMDEAKAHPGEPTTMYLAEGTTPRLYLTGPNINPWPRRAGMVPVFTFTAHPKPEPQLRLPETMGVWHDLEEEAYESDSDGPPVP